MTDQTAQTTAEEAVWERRLVLFLRLCALITGFAIVPVFFPLPWMDDIHVQLIGQKLPQGPIVPYLARSLSAFYAMHGGLLFVISCDVRRFAPVLSFLIWTGLAFGLGLGVIDTLAGLPLQWTVGEVFSVLALMCVLLFLKTKARV